MVIEGYVPSSILHNTPNLWRSYPRTTATRTASLAQPSDGLLAERSWLAAGQFTIADIALLAYTRLASEGGFELAARESLVAWKTAPA